MRFYPFVFLPERMRTACDRSGANGKERDILRLNPQSGGLCGDRLTSPQDLLTGYGYLPRQARQAHHGARYMDHELMTMWLSVDPMADKYPSISPSAYCAWNPIKQIDPDGREIDEWKYNTTTGMLSWESDKGGNNHQTVDFVEGVGNLESLKKSVSFDGQIQDMFDFSVISEKADKITDGLIQMTGAAFTIGGGVLVGYGSGGSAAPAGNARILRGQQRPAPIPLIVQEG